MKNPKKRLLGIVLLGSSLRLLGFLSRPIWYDEAFSLLFAASGPRAMLRGTLSPDLAGAAAEEHPLGYYSLLWAWGQIWGNGVPAARALSLVFGLAIVLLIYWIGHRMFSEPVALAGAALTAIAPFQIHHSQEVRMYGLMAVGLIVATWAFWEARGQRQRSGSQRWSWWLLFAIAAAMTQYAHNLAAIYLLVLAATPVWERDWRKVRQVFLAGSLAILFYLPWLVQLPAQFGKLDSGFWTSHPGVARLLTALMTFVSNLPLPGPWLIVGLAATLLGVTFAAWQTWRAFRNKLPGYRRGLWLAYLSFGPLFLLFLISQIVPVFIERALLANGAICMLWIAWALLETRFPALMRNFVFAALVLGMGAGIWIHVTYQGFPYAPFAELNAAIQAEMSPKDVIIHANKLSYLPAYVDSPDLASEFIADPVGSGSDTLAGITQEVLGIEAKASAELAAEGADRVWYVVFSQAAAEIDRGALIADPSQKWLDANYTHSATNRWGDLVVYVYEH